MNHKIRNLYQQSVLYTQQNAGRKGQRSVEMMCAKKFAELIIEECARLAAATACPYVADDRMMQHIGHTWDMACHAAGKEIRENFKVK